MYLRSKIAGPLGRNIKWNFTKFLVDRRGRPVARYSPPTAPLSMLADIEKLLDAPAAEPAAAA